MLKVILKTVLNSQALPHLDQLLSLEDYFAKEINIGLISKSLSTLLRKSDKTNYMLNS